MSRKQLVNQNHMENGHQTYMYAYSAFFLPIPWQTIRPKQLMLNSCGNSILFISVFNAYKRPQRNNDTFMLI